MGAFKLGKMTFGSLFKKPETVLYPVQVKPQPAGLKGRIAIDVGSCILCGMCERSCTTGCIEVDKQGGTWAINRLQCVQCGYCITVCPKDCLSMDPNYTPAQTGKHLSVYMVDQGAGACGKQPDDASADKPEAAPSGKPKAGATDDGPKAGAAGSGGAGFAHANELATEQPFDQQIQSLLGMMDADKADKVRSALKG